MIRWLAVRLARWKADRQQHRDLLRSVKAQQRRRSSALADPDLSALEERYAVRLPEDFRRYLLATMPRGKDWDDEGTRWLPLAEIKSLREECSDWTSASALDSDKLLVFADFLIWSHAWAIDCSETENRGKVALITGDDHYVADSLDNFLDRYLRDDSALYR